jgi:hypothetical protein
MATQSTMATLASPVASISSDLLSFISSLSFASMPAFAQPFHEAAAGVC